MSFFIVVLCQQTYNFILFIAQMKLFFVAQTLLFKRTFSIAHGSRNSTPVVFTRLEYDGIFGYGEASMPPYLGENHETASRFLFKAEKILTDFSDPMQVDIILSAIDKIDSANTAAKASIDIALHDLNGKLLNKSCHKMFGADEKRNIFTAYTIPIDEPNGIKSRIEEANNYKILKVKLGSDDDKKIIDHIRNHTDKKIIVDANEGWHEKNMALEMLCWLAERNVVFVEQPMPKKMIDECAWLTEKSPIPIIADEAVQRLDDLEKVQGVYNGINIKLMKCTGLNEAYKMIQLAKKYKMKTMMGCMSESSCGTSAAAQLAPLVDWVDLDGPLLIKEDYFDGVKFSEGQILLNNQPGIGVKLISDIFK